jgi:exopolysaccharide biosynthesis predicted pyruvyltransferase EpsI
MQHLELIAALRTRIEETLRPLLAGSGPVALLEFPNHPNVGDSAIYLGALSCLAALGQLAPAYLCDFRTYDRALLARRLASGGTILLSGGGTFGDVWEEHHRRREEIVAAFPEHRIVQLPQTVHFRSRSALARARAVFQAHPDFLLLARDRRSLATAREELAVRTQLCPDLAFCLGPLARPAAPTQPLLWLARTDLEAAASALPEPPVGVRTDWLAERPSARRLLTELLVRLVRLPLLDRALREALTATYAPLARERLRRGCRLLSTGRTVVTDRLHGHILCVLLGIPHLLLDNSYGKVSSFHETWTSGLELVRFAGSAEEALAHVQAAAVTSA